MTGLVSVAQGSRVVRVAREADVDRLLEIHVAAFPDPRPIEVRRRVFQANRLGGFEHLRVVEQAGDVVAHAFSFPIGVWIGGAPVRGSAVASVGVAVEARGQGVAKALLGAIHDEAHVRGDAFTLLYPFREGFYGALGYVPVARHRVLSVSPRAIPKGWNQAAPGAIRRATGDDRAELARVYRAAALRGTGFITRPDRAWEYDLVDERRQWLVLDAGRELSGYLCVRLHQSEPHARVRAEVHELVSSDDSVRRRLFGALRGLGDQVGDISVALADDDPLHWAFVDADRDRSGTKEVEHAQGVINTGPMIRLVDPKTALLARGYAADGSLDLAITGRGEGAGETCFTLHVENGVARVSSLASRSETALGMSLETLAAVAFGGLGMRDAQRLGWLGLPESASQGDHAPQHLRAAADLLAIPAFFSVDAF
jgi:predicted acetyltransferase